MRVVEGEEGGIWGERLSVREEGRVGGSELDSDLDPDPWKYYGSGTGKMMRIHWIRIPNSACNPGKVT